MELLLALALVQDPLGGDDIEVREAAARDLVGLGEAALPDLRRRMAEATSTEARLRLQGVIARVETDRRRREFGGGNEIDGLRARLVKVENPPDARIPYRLEIMNVDAAARPFVPVLAWNSSLPGFSSSRSGAGGRVELKRLDNPPLSGRFCGRTSCGGGPDRTPVLLRPGEVKSYALLPDEALAPGRYELKASYFAKRLLDAAEDVVSDVVQFTIPGAEAVEDDDLDRFETP